MANKQLIQGAALTNKKFVDVGDAVGKGFSGYQRTKKYVNPRVAKNKAIQSRVNSYMGKMKTDQDFTGFSPGETASMRDFLVQKRGQYADAAKSAASFKDTTDPRYMEAVDIMQGVNNSFTNLAKSLESYKVNKLEYAQGQQNGSFSDGTSSEVAEQTASMYGFYDDDNDSSTSKVGGKNASFSIRDSGDLGFTIGGQDVDYSTSQSLVLKDYKLGLGLLKNNEAAYKAATPQSEASLNMYRLELEQGLQNPDSVKSMIFDFNDELETTDLQDAITSGEIDVDDARELFIDRMVNSRKNVSQQGYDEKVAKARSRKQATAQRRETKASLKSNPAKPSKISEAEINGALKMLGIKKDIKDLSEEEGLKVQSTIFETRKNSL